MTRKPENLELIATDARGIYIPQHVCEACELHPINASDADRLQSAIADCLLGPHDNESYWDAWSEVLDLACIRIGRARWRLYQEGDCWAIRMNRAGQREAAKCFGWDD